MIWSRRLLGVTSSTLGVVGLLICLVGAVAVWELRGHADDAVVRIFERVDAALEDLGQQAEEASDRVSNTQTSLHDLNERVRQRLAKSGEISLDEAAGIAGIAEIERRFYARIDRVQDWLRLMHASAELVEQLAEIGELSFLAFESRQKTVRRLIDSIRAGTDDIMHVVALAEDAKLQLIEIRTNQMLGEHAEQFESLYARIDRLLTAVKEHTEACKVGIADFRMVISQDGVRIRRWLLIAASVLTFLLAWMAIAQFSLAVHGWKLLQKRRRVKDSSRPTVLASRRGPASK